MIEYNVEQGSPEWHKLRADIPFTASRAAAMMGDSKYQSRNDLLAELSGRKPEEVDSFKQKLFDSGHEAEERARKHLEADTLEDYHRTTGAQEVDDLMLLASFDGLTDNLDIWEHKVWNKTLAENVRNGVLEPHYYWQLEHQMLVAGKNNCLFQVSDGTPFQCEKMVYVSIKERREALIAGWKQFAKDLKEYKPKVVKEKPVAKSQKNLPAIAWKVDGSMITTNLSTVIPILRERCEDEMAKNLETDQDFADKEAFVKQVKETRGRIATVKEGIKQEFTSVAEVEALLAEADSILQKAQSHGEKQVKEQKERIKQDILRKAQLDLHAFFAECNKRTIPVDVLCVSGVPPRPDLALAMKGKKTVTSLQSAVDDGLASFKAGLETHTAHIEQNLHVYNATVGGYGYLFGGDLNTLLALPLEAFTLTINQRIDAQKAHEAQKEQEQRDRIREEEAKKAQEAAQKKLDEERAQIAAQAREDERKANVEAMKKDQEQAKKTAEEHRKVMNDMADSGTGVMKDGRHIPVSEFLESTRDTAQDKPFKEHCSLGEEIDNWAKHWGLSKEAEVDLTSILIRWGVIDYEGELVRENKSN